VHLSDCVQTPAARRAPRLGVRGVLERVVERVELGVPVRC